VLQSDELAVALKGIYFINEQLGIKEEARPGYTGTGFFF